MRGLACRSVVAVVLCVAGCGDGGGTSPTPVPTPTPEMPSSSAYLQDVSASSAVVSHYSATDDVYRAEWSLAAGGGFLGRAQETAPTRYHALRIGPLVPDTFYSYRLRSGTGALVAEGRFTTPPPARTRAVTFAAIGDSGWPGGMQAQVAASMAPTAPELVLHLGDVVYPHGERENYPQWHFEPFAKTFDRAPLFPTLGNHDLETEKGQPWLDAFTTPANGLERSERYYSLDWGDVHFLALDVVSTDFSRGSRQWTFADADLAASAAAWKIVSLHRAPYSAGPSGGAGDVRRELLPLFQERKVDVVLAGHDHGYQRFLPRRGIEYIVSAGGGATLEPIRDVPELAFHRQAYHFVRGRADASSLVLEAVDTSGAAFDRLALKK